MFWICNILNRSIPTCTTFFTLVSLFLCRAALPICHHSAGPWPEAHGPLINHVGGHSNDQVPWYLVHVQAFNKLRFTGWHPVLRIRRLPTDSEYILEMLK